MKIPLTILWKCRVYAIQSVGIFEWKLEQLKQTWRSIIVVPLNDCASKFTQIIKENE